MKRNNTLKDTIYQNIMNSILSLEYGPNDILTERELIEKYGCSKSPVRDALIALCNENVLVSHPRYGYEVVRLTTKDIQEILDYRLTLESALLQRSCTIIMDSELEELQRLHMTCIQTLKKDMWSHWEANTQFHLYLASCAKNQFARQQLESAMLTLKRAYAQSHFTNWSPSHPNDDTRYHELIIEGLSKKEQGLCMAALHDDLNDFAL